MVRAKVTSRGQVTIPKAVRDRLGLRPGDEIEFVDEGSTYRLQKRLVASPFEKYRGYLKHLAGQDADDLVASARGGRRRAVPPP